MSEVAPFTGAWIETRKTQYVTDQFRVAPFTGAWIETETTVSGFTSPSRTLHGCVD